MASAYSSTFEDGPPDQTDKTESSRNFRKSQNQATTGIGGAGEGPTSQASDSDSGFHSTTKDVYTDATKDSKKDSVRDLERKFRYLKFEDYQFDNDDQFQSGWKKLAGVVPPSERDKQYLKAKLFYYSKHIEAVDIDEYMKWKEDPVNKNEKTERGVATPQVWQLSGKGDNSCSPVATTDGSNTKTAPESGTLSFSEVIDFIQSGKTIPGLKTVDAKPTDANPSPSTMNRKAKPWER
ncbi:uncharacterized protein LOC124275338 [Haliotis rubra]|uniref:uncharacterized protein LOC124275338 n=1 Tax=Haliotis rubra TaxID=36100 RepID=UPI001EE51497|nr:uncharacterized protein LOC124275338 [Haliotis rubra]